MSECGDGLVGDAISGQHLIATARPIRGSRAR